MVQVEFRNYSLNAMAGNSHSELIKKLLPPNIQSVPENVSKKFYSSSFCQRNFRKITAEFLVKGTAEHSYDGSPFLRASKFSLGAHPLPWETSAGGRGTTSSVSDGAAVALAQPHSTVPGHIIVQRCRYDGSRPTSGPQTSQGFADRPPPCLLLDVKWDRPQDKTLHTKGRQPGSLHHRSESLHRPSGESAHLWTPIMEATAPPLSLRLDC